MVIDDVCGGQVLETLGSEQMMPSTAAQCVAYIACAELPEGSWPEMMTLLTTNVTNPNSTEMLKESSLEAVGYICQDIVCSSIVLFMDTERFTVHIPFCRAMNKCGLRRSLSICVSGSCVLSKQINIFFLKISPSNDGHTFLFFVPNVMAIFRRGPPTGSNIAIFDRCLALALITAGLHVINICHGEACVVLSISNDQEALLCDTSVNLMYDIKPSLRQRQQNRI